MKKIMFDTNVFDELINIIEKIKESAQNQYEYYITTIQIEELCEIPDDKIKKRKINILMLADLRAKLVPISIAPLNGRWLLGYARLGKGEVCDKILNSKKSNFDDAIIADTAVYEGCTLVTNDKKLYKKMIDNEYDCKMLEDFLASIKPSI